MVNFLDMSKPRNYSILRPPSGERTSYGAQILSLNDCGSKEIFNLKKHHLCESLLYFSSVRTTYKKGFSANLLLGSREGVIIDVDNSGSLG